MHIDKNILTYIIEILQQDEKPFMHSKEIAIAIQHYYPTALLYENVDVEKCVMTMFYHIQVLSDLGRIKLANPIAPHMPAKPLGFVLFAEETGGKIHETTLFYDETQFIRLAHLE